MPRNAMHMHLPKGLKRRCTRAIVVSIVVLVVATVLSCSKKREAAHPNIIMIVVDTLRADHLSSYGYARKTDPNIAEFAKQAVVFQRAVAPAPWTMPAYTSMLEGKFAFNHNMNTPTEKIPQGTLLTSYLRDAGYHTASIQTNDMAYFLSSGDYFDDNFYYFQDQGDVYLDRQAGDSALEWLSNSTKTTGNFFFLVGMMSPHWDYKTRNGYLSEFIGDPVYNAFGPVAVDIMFGRTTPQGIWKYDDLSPDLQAIVGMPQNSEGYYDEARLYIAGYDSEIKYSDHQIGRILQKLKDIGLYDDAIIIITGDHGENMNDHRHYFNHSDNLYQSLLHVPLLIKFPRQKVQATVAEYVRTIDILPTVFDYATIKYSGTDGKSLMPFIRGESVDFEERPVISYRIDSSGYKAVSLIKGDYKLIRNTGSELTRLYNLHNDPNETTDVSTLEPDRVAQLREYLDKYFQQW